MKITIAMLDPSGMPRAWGSADSYGKALQEATDQLVKYIAEKRKLGDPLADAEYKPKVVRKIVKGG